MFFCSFSDMQVPLQAFLDGKNGGKSIEIRSKVANVETGSGICPGKGKKLHEPFFFCMERFMKLFPGLPLYDAFGYLFFSSYSRLAMMNGPMAFPSLFTMVTSLPHR